MVDAEETKSCLLEAHEHSDGRAEFLIASLRPPKLGVVKGGVAEVADTGWLGDLDAFDEYQRHYHALPFPLPVEMFDSPQRAGDIEIADRMGRGMQAVVYGPSLAFENGKLRALIPRGGSHETVGEAIVYAVPRVEDNLFKYSVYSRTEAPPFREPLPARDGVTPADFGSTERGSFSCLMLTPVQPGVGAIGLYFPEGQLGVLYAPLLLDEPEQYSSMAREAFIECVRFRHDIALQGIGG
jgi:hypothetical protein